MSTIGIIYNSNTSIQILPSIDQVLNRTVRTGQCSRGDYSSGNYLVRNSDKEECYHINEDDDFILMEQIPKEVIISLPIDNDAQELSKKLARMLWRSETTLKVKPTYGLLGSKEEVINSRYELEKTIKFSLIGVDNNEIVEGNRTLSSQFLDRSLKDIDRNILIESESVSLSYIKLIDISNALYEYS